MLMKKLKTVFSRFTKGELLLWTGSMLLILLSFVLFDRQNYLNMIWSLMAVTALIFVAKGDPLGQFLFIFFEIMYAIISLSYSYYGEAITYLFMSLPMTLLSLISWLKNPYKDNKNEVEVNHVGKKEFFLMLIGDAIVTVIFYFLLGWFGTANLLVSTFSVATSFAAAYLIFRRSPFFPLGYAINDLVLIVLWSLAAFDDISYLSVAICFVAFLVNDTYSFISWRRMEKRQKI